MTGSLTGDAYKHGRSRETCCCMANVRVDSLVHPHTMLLAVIAVMQLYAPSVAKYEFVPGILESGRLVSLQVYQVSGKAHRLKQIELINCSGSGVTAADSPRDLFHINKSFGGKQGLYRRACGRGRRILPA